MSCWSSTNLNLSANPKSGPSHCLSGTAVDQRVVFQAATRHLEWTRRRRPRRHYRLTQSGRLKPLPTVGLSCAEAADKADKRSIPRSQPHRSRSLWRQGSSFSPEVEGRWTRNPSIRTTEQYLAPRGTM